jgi:hypothetical protein
MDQKFSFRSGKYHKLCVTSGFRREVAENCVLLGFYVASSGNLLPKFRGFFILEP